MPVKSRLPKCYSNYWTERITKNLDSTDGLAAAVCHFQFRKVVGTKSYTGWDAFVKQNEEREVKIGHV
jgi:crossover junction endodeoxyribonuclease RuvC